MSELKSCPFCQSSAVALKENEDHDTWWVECDSCETKGPASYERQDGMNATTNHKEFAVELWNTRATTPNAAGAEDAEALLMMALPYAVENFVLPDEIREGIVAAIKVDVESHARHTAAKAVEDERARLRGLVDASDGYALEQKGQKIGMYIRGNGQYLKRDQLRSWLTDAPIARENG